MRAAKPADIGGQRRARHGARALALPSARLRDPMVGILIRTRIGMDVYGTNTRIEQTQLGDFQPGDELEVDFRIECWLTPQSTR